MNTPDVHPILIVEDCPEDHEALRRSLRNAGLANPIYVCDDGDSALNYLRRQGEYEQPSTSPRPGLILLDLTLPATDGREVLREIKSDPGLKGIPVVVMTSSTDDRDIQESYLAGANSYVTKPVDLDGLVSAVRRLREFWFGIVVLPRVEAS